jgi:hypothetical protein
MSNEKDTHTRFLNHSLRIEEWMNDCQLLGEMKTAPRLHVYWNSS